VVAVALVLAGCSGGGDDAGPTPSTAAGATTTITSAPAATISVVLAADRLVVGGNALVYGAPRSQVRAYLDRALGAPTASEDQECGPGRLESHRWDGLTAYVDATGFVGWSADDDTFATDRGVRIGSARSDVESAHPGATVTESSLGTEFLVAGPAEGTGLSGVYEDDEVVALWSGATCVAR